MNTKILKTGGTYIGVVVTTMLVLASPVRGELVFDDEGSDYTSSNALVTDGTPSEREGVRQILRPAENARATAENPVAARQSVENLGRAELLRRERLRKELQNEDVLQVRLEELRLRDETRRTQELLGAGELPAAGLAGVTGPTGVIQAAPVEQEVISAELADTAPFPVQDRVVTAQAAPQQVAMMQQPMMAAPIMTSDASFRTAEEEKQRIFIQPRGGVAGFLNDGNQVQGRFSAGIGAGMEVSDNMTFELGYTYAEYGVVGSGFQQGWNTGWNMGWNTGWNQGLNPEPYVMKQNLIDAGLKVSLLGRDSKLRPFLGGGAAYGKSFVNYDERMVAYYRSMNRPDMARDYETTAFMGYLSTGFDLQLSKSMSVGAGFRYYTVMTARESQNFNQWANPWGAWGAADADKQQVGSVLARASFYSILAGVSFMF